MLDLDFHYFQSTVEAGIINGYNDGTFKPENNFYENSKLYYLPSTDF
ncbi:S-layer homology domain-containing protein [Lysinibacillus fusiformis]|nr:S-layer homology domain-containing protein [Lysinibacillus fusiformis]